VATGRKTRVFVGYSSLTASGVREGKRGPGAVRLFLVALARHVGLPGCRRPDLALALSSIQVDHFPFLVVAIIARLLLGIVVWRCLLPLREGRETGGLALEKAYRGRPDFLKAVGDTEESAEEHDQVGERSAVAVEGADG